MSTLFITRWLRWSIPGLLGSTLVTAALVAFPVAGCAGDQHHERAGKEKLQNVQILAVNDFHGQIGEGLKVGGRPVGSAPVLASYLEDAAQGQEMNTFIVHAGDFVGASMPQSALLQDEPSIQFFNLLGNHFCKAEYVMHPKCNLLGTVGNHEFDEGWEELVRLLEGGNHVNGPYLQNPWLGANFPHVCANIVDEEGEPVLPPYVIKHVNDTRVAFIGAILKDTPSIVSASGIAGLHFLDEAEAINTRIAEVRGKGVEAIVVVIHQGGSQDSNGEVSGDIVPIVERLAAGVDVVISGHWHAYTDTMLTNSAGEEVLVTQAYSKGSAYADIDLVIDRRTGDVVEKSAEIVTTWADEGPGLIPDLKATQLVADAKAATAPLTERVVGYAAEAVSRTQNEAGESTLGNLIADAQRAAMGTDFAFMNSGGIRADLDMGDITWGELYTIQPFNNYLVTMELTGQQIYSLLNQQYTPYQPYNRMLQISGLSYTWDASRPANDLVVEVRKDGVAIDKAATYTVTVNSFIAGGGDKFSVLLDGVNPRTGPIDLDILLKYIEEMAGPVSSTIDGRIERQN